jgi:hypothetical protein
MPTLQEIIEACKRKDYEAMPLCFPFKLMAPVILMVATCETHLSHRGIALAKFDKNLSTSPSIIKSMYSIVDLGDFLQAYNLAADADAVNDPAIAKTIYAYVKTHKLVLEAFLDQDVVPQEFKDECIKAFPFFAKK